MRTRLSIALVAGTLVAVAIPQAAFAESNFTTYLSGVTNGRESRTWHDNNSDNTTGYVKFKGCTSNPDVGTYRERTALPDAEVARGIMWCLGPSDGPVATLINGDTAAGNYHFTIKDTRGSTGFLTVNTVKVEW